MTGADVERVVAEVERRFRERTPAKQIDEVNASYRVGRGEIRRWASEQGIALDEMDDALEVALLRLFARLRREFPFEMWDDWNSRTRELAKAHGIVLPRPKKRPEENPL